MYGNPNILNLIGYGFTNDTWLILMTIMVIYAVFTGLMWSISTRRPGWDSSNEAILGRYLTIFSMTSVFTAILFIVMMAFLMNGWQFFGYVK